MKSLVEYNWLTSYLDFDAIWLEESLNWDDIVDLVFAEGPSLPILFLGALLNSHFTLDMQTKISYSDILFLLEADLENLTQVFFNFFFADRYISTDLNMIILNSLFFTDYQDFFLLVLNHSPELLLVLSDFIQYDWSNFTLVLAPTTLFDIFSDTLVLTISDLLDYFLLFIFFSWGLILLVGSLQLTNWRLALDPYSLRLLHYFFSISREVRLQFEATLLVIFIFLIYFSFMIAAFDDDQEEGLEWLNTSSFYLFLSLFIYLLYRYSIHYFSFLQASETKGKYLRLLIQLAQDLVNTFALFLRFIVLIIRLNMYDFLDDVLDSYYIFVCDFDDDEYFSETNFSIFGILFFDTDNHDDRSIFLEDELDFSLDIFSLYFILWSKFIFFFFFAIDEIARVFLAFYLVYLMIFEIQAVNRSYTEDNYTLFKR